MAIIAKKEEYVKESSTDKRDFLHLSKKTYRKFKGLAENPSSHFNNCKIHGSAFGWLL